MGIKPIVAAIVLAAGFAVIGTGAAAAGGDGAAAQAGKPDKSKRICRNIVPSGTRMAKRYCRTQEEWDNAGDKNRDFLMDGQLKGSRRDAEFVGMDKGYVRSQ